MQADDAGDGKAHSSVDLAQGLVAGWMSDQVNDRGTGENLCNKKWL